MAVLSNIWLVALERQDLEDRVLGRQDLEDRVLPCAALILVRNVVPQVYLVAMIFNLVFRSLIIFYADRGLVKDGKPNLELLRKLFWLVVVAFLLVGLTIFPINPLVLGTFPRDGIDGRICLLRDTSPELVDKVEGARVRKLVYISFMSLDIFNLFYFNSRVNRFLKGFCPNGRMSCIGLYKRNVISLSQTVYLTFLGVVFIILRMASVLFIQENTLELSKKANFWVWNINEIFSCEGFYFFCFPFMLNVEGSKTQAPQRPTMFYVRKPTIQPRRPENKWTVPYKNVIDKRESEQRKCPLILYCRTHKSMSVRTEISSDHVKMIDLRNPKLEPFPKKKKKKKELLPPKHFAVIHNDTQEREAYPEVGQSQPLNLKNQAEIFNVPVRPSICEVELPSSSKEDSRDMFIQLEVNPLSNELDKIEKEGLPPLHKSKKKDKEGLKLPRRIWQQKQYHPAE